MSRSEELVEELAELFGLSSDRVHAALRALRGESVDGAGDPDIDQAYLLRMLQLDAAFRIEHRLVPGDVVQWKTGLRNKRRPEDGAPAVVVERLTEPVYDGEEGAGSPYFREPLDMVVGLLDEDGDYTLYHVDSRRFEPYGPPAPPPSN